MHTHLFKIELLKYMLEEIIRFYLERIDEHKNNAIIFISIEIFQFRKEYFHFVELTF